MLSVTEARLQGSTVKDQWDHIKEDVTGQGQSRGLQPPGGDSG